MKWTLEVVQEMNRRCNYEYTSKNELRAMLGAALAELSGIAFMNSLPPAKRKPATDSDGLDAGGISGAVEGAAGAILPSVI